MRIWHGVLRTRATHVRAHLPHTHRPEFSILDFDGAQRADNLPAAEVLGVGVDNGLGSSLDLHVTVQTMGQGQRLQAVLGPNPPWPPAGCGSGTRPPAAAVAFGEQKPGNVPTTTWLPISIGPAVPAGKAAQRGTALLHCCTAGLGHGRTDVPLKQLRIP